MNPIYKPKQINKNKILFLDESTFYTNGEQFYNNSGTLYSGKTK